VVVFVVNGRLKRIEGPARLTHAQLVRLAYPEATETDPYTVVYRRKKCCGNKDRDGSVQPGETVEVKTSMVINVALTTNS
jgi:hypothetical protein